MSSDETAEGPGAADPQGKVTDPRAMRALAHPVRIALIELLPHTGTLTATQASELLGESPANCAFHLRTLAKYGFVEEAGGGSGPGGGCTRPSTFLMTRRARRPRWAPGPSPTSWPTGRWGGSAASSRSG